MIETSRQVAIVATALVIAAPLGMAQELATTVRASALAPETERRDDLNLESQRDTGRSLLDLIDDLPGVGVLRSGGEESFASISLRALTGHNVAVLINRMPTSNATLLPVDLGLMGVGSLDRAAIYYGTSPARMTTPLGGVIDLRTVLDGAESMSASLTLGSWRQSSVAVAARGHSESTRYALRAGARAGRYDFTYYDDAGTPLSLSDDRTRKRRGNGASRMFASVDLGWQVTGAEELRLSLRADGRQRDIPGHSALVSPLDAGSSDSQVLARLDLERLRISERSSLGVGVDAAFSVRSFSDPSGSLNFGLSSDSQTLIQSGIDAEFAAGLGDAQELSVTGRFQHHTFRSMATAPQSLNGISSGIRYRVRPIAILTLEPTLRGDITSANALRLSPRLGTKWVLGACVLRGSTGQQHRMPTAIERFGDNASLIANPDLESEKSWSHDLGSKCTWRIAGHKLSPEIALFRIDAQGLIRPLASSPSSFRAQNLDDQRIFGSEVRGAWRYRRLGARLGYAWSDARSTTKVPGLGGKQTPGIPLHRFDGSIVLYLPSLEVSYRADFVSQRYFDSANLQANPGRLLHDASVVWRATEELTGSVLVTNLTDRRRDDLRLATGRQTVTGLADLQGYPIPGRSIFATLTLRSPL
jgi:outer membrane cobalamin receptor